MSQQCPAMKRSDCGRIPNSGERPKESSAMKYTVGLAAAVVMIGVLIPVLAGAQTQPAEDGIDNGNYHYQGSFELGYRFVNTDGNSAVYDTFVNQQQGPRLLDQTLNMRSLNHEGTLFDNLFMSSFGWGGDPENATRLRVSKNKWYNFSLTFRRDQNVWDYNLLANPLNPPNSFIPVSNTPHEFLTTRRMYDYNLTLLPQSKVRFRLGFNRNNMEGPSYSSYHGGTDTQLLQSWRTLVDGYQFGVDVKVLPRTNISYDQFLEYYRGDTSWSDAHPFAAQLSDGSFVDPGIIYNEAAGQPCSNTPTPIFDPSTSPPTLRATCNGYQGYARVAPTRVSYPTEQLTLQSSYFRRVDLSARFAYSSSESKVNNYNELFLGLSSRTAQRFFDISGFSRARRVTANADLGMTFRVTDQFRLVDTFRFSNFRIPGYWNTSQVSGFPLDSPASLLSPIATFDPTTCAGDPTTCPKHSSSSPADVSSQLVQRFIGEDSKYNTIEAEYDFTRRVGARIGYRYGHRAIPLSTVSTIDEVFYPNTPNRGDCVGMPLNADGTCSFSGNSGIEADSIPVNEHSGLFGVWAHPTDALRMNFDVEVLTADNAPTRISPRNLQRFKGRVHYKPRDWMTVSGTVNLLESRNNVPDVLHREHNRNYGFALSLYPRERFGIDLGYNYDDIYSTTNICYVITSTPPADSTFCSAGTPYISAVSLYDNKINFGYANIMFKPVKRVTTNFGYDLTSSSGDTSILSPTPNTLGPLGLNYHKPFASVDVALARGITWRSGWNYWGYNEKSSSAPLPARDFHSNSATLSLRYDF